MFKPTGEKAAIAYSVLTTAALCFFSDPKADEEKLRQQEQAFHEKGIATERKQSFYLVNGCPILEERVVPKP